MIGCTQVIYNIRHLGLPMAPPWVPNGPSWAPNGIPWAPLGFHGPPMGTPMQPHGAPMDCPWPPMVPQGPTRAIHGPPKFVAQFRGADVSKTSVFTARGASPDMAGQLTSEALSVQSLATAACLHSESCRRGPLCSSLRCFCRPLCDPM